MAANILIGVLIFGYASWALFNFIKKSKNGKCTSCSLKKSCSSSCSSISDIQK
ncbi:FeoB-associated Cys-rich membrane protein [Cytobacillus dafuensis]|uniref:FeoB-associated Cys-rich membrane protein n=1 Tax=Cytobacillus dafuensis TaxID=1742359 RepID=A0A5B8Z655_CYTDA|nr:FeoB-associated Cys-rich membrane protein [Cytobacillus dafuensis]QED47099.1 FeoB-associated Cys-rich membrane protein [Cytobacillus dafuensis]